MEIVPEGPLAVHLKDLYFHIVVQLDVPSMGCLFRMNKDWYEYGKNIWNNTGSLFINNHCLYMDLLGRMACYNHNLFKSTVEKNPPKDDVLEFLNLHYPNRNPFVLKEIVSDDKEIKCALFIEYCQAVLDNKVDEGELLSAVWYCHKKQNHNKDNNCVRIIKLLLAHNIGINSKSGNTPLHIAIEKKVNSDIIKMLLPKSDLTMQNNQVGTSFNLLISKLLSKNEYEQWYIDVLKLFLEKDSKILNQQDNEGRAPLHMVFFQQRSDFIYQNVVPLLIEYPEVNYNLQDNKQRTPLHLAMQYSKNLDAILLLLHQKDIDVNIKDDFGYTSFHIFIAQDIFDMPDNQDKAKKVLNLLLQKGAVLDIPNQKGVTPIERAKQKKRSYLDLLIEYEKKQCQKNGEVDDKKQSRINKRMYVCIVSVWMCWICYLLVVKHKTLNIPIV